MDSFIRVHNETLEPEFCQRVIDMFEASPDKHEGKTSSGKVQSIKRSWDLHYDQVKNPEWQEIDRVLHKTATEFTARYFKEFERHFTTVTTQMGDTGFCVRKYEKSIGGFDEHVDVGGLKTSDRLLALMWYLNDVEDGGETKFVQQGVGIIPRVGRLAIFPTYFTHLHQGCVPRSGPKYIINTFITYAGV